MGAVTHSIQSAIPKKKKRMKFACGLVLCLLTFTHAKPPPPGGYGGGGKGKLQCKYGDCGKGKLENPGKYGGGEKEKREAKKYYYGEGETTTTTEAEDEKLQVYKGKREAKPWASYPPPKLGEDGDLEAEPVTYGKKKREAEGEDENLEVTGYGNLEGE